MNHEWTQMNTGFSDKISFFDRSLQWFRQHSWQWNSFSSSVFIGVHPWFKK